MIGNDIVDLRYAKNSKWQHPRFLEKVFTLCEQELIIQSSNRFSTIWQLWAIKEAAYKAYLQKYPSRFFNSKAFICCNLSSLTEVSYNDFRIKVQSVINTNMVYAETISQKPVYRKILKVLPDHKFQSKQIRQALISKVSEQLNIDKKSLTVRKDRAGIPNVYLENSKLKAALSITHHGDYAAYSISYS